MELRNKIILVTGGQGLIGMEFCRKILENGGVPISADIVNHQIFQNEDSIWKVHLDINSTESILNCISVITAKFGKIDAIINNAYPRNKNYGRKLFDVDYLDFCENVNLHLGGYFLAMQIFSKQFIKQGFGKIINISSIYGVIAPKFELYDGTNMTMPVEYAVIKSSIIHLTKYFAKYLKGNNISVNSISFGGIKDNQPLEFQKKYHSFCINKGMLDIEDTGGILIFLLSEYSNFINGQNFIIDDGFTL
jgi:NAD(P)-dependent dehydrogenase (short-subunit alcohol dehydrogenase family)